MPQNCRTRAIACSAVSLAFNPSAANAELRADDAKQPDINDKTTDAATIIKAAMVLIGFMLVAESSPMRPTQASVE